jgi:hypothetical protein
MAGSNVPDRVITDGLCDQTLREPATHHAVLEFEGQTIDMGKFCKAHADEYVEDQIKAGKATPEELHIVPITQS